jgi:hypothetical protein
MMLLYYRQWPIYLDADEVPVEFLKRVLGDDIPGARNHLEDKLHNKNTARIKYDIFYV